MLGSAVVYAAVSAGIIYLLITALLAWFKYLKKVKTIHKIPGVEGYPLIGNAMELMGSHNYFYFRVLSADKLIGQSPKGITRLWLGYEPMIILSSPSGVEKVLSSPTYIEKSFLYKFMHPWLGTGLLTSTGKKWFTRRKLLTPAFHFRILEDFLQIMIEQSVTLVKLLEEKATGETFDMFPYITNCALDIICDSAMGCNVKAQQDDSSDYVKAVNRMGYLVQQRQRSPWIQPDAIFRLTKYYNQQKNDLNILHSFTRKVIEERRATRNDKSAETETDESTGIKKRLAFLDLLLSTTSNGQPLTNQDIQEEVDTFMFEGHDTTAAGINWCLFLLGLYPEFQEECFKELEEIFGDSDRPPNSEDLRKMKYLECCIKEAQRLYPSVPFIGRQLREDTIIEGYNIPADSTLFININALHQNPDVWPDPYNFNPDRFTPENFNKMHPYSYVPFSAGPRNCIGQKFAMMEEKVIVSSVLRRFRLESCERRDKMTLNGALILRPDEGLIMKFFKRN